MPTNDFEKQVQQKMDELRFVPSEAVWPAVEKQIRQRKDRRRLLLWWWLLPFLAGGSILYFYTNHTNDTNKANGVVIAKTTGSPTGKNTNATHIVNGAPAKDAGNIQKPDADSSINNKSAISNKSVAARLYNSSPYYRRIYDNKGRAQIVRAGITTAITTTTTTAADAKNGDAEKAAVKDNDNKVTAIVTVPDMENAEVDAGLKPASVNPLGKKIFTASPLAPSVETGNVKKPAPFKKKMEWVVQINTGMAGISSGVSPFVTSTAALDRLPGSLYYAAAPGNGVTSGSSSQARISGRPSDIRPAFSFGVGLSLRTYIDPTFSLEAGLRYSYYSNSMTTGIKVDSSVTVRRGSKKVPGYYNNYSVSTSAGNIDYQNRYHFIEIPIRMQKQLGMMSPFSLQVGLTIGQMLGSNALQYDADQNIYYKDNSLFNKTQLTLSAGMDFRLWRNRPVSFEMGPRLQYGLSNFIQKDIYGSRHLLFAGLETRVFFKKR